MEDKIILFAFLTPTPYNLLTAYWQKVLNKPQGGKRLQPDIPSCSISYDENSST